MSTRRHSTRDAIVGVVVALAVFIFAVAVFSIGSEQRLWSRKAAYKIRLPNTGGLQIGAPVRLAGVQVGTVTDIQISPDPNRAEIDITLKVDATVEPRIRADTQASLKVLSLLSGDKYLELTTGSPGEPLLPPGSYVGVPEAMGFEELQALGATIADDLKEITSSLKVILDQLQDRDTIIGQALFDPNFGDETLGNLKQAVIASNHILQRIDSGEGLLGRLVSDKEFAASAMSGIEGSLKRIESLLARLEDEKGTLSQALAPGGSMATSLANIEKSTQTLLSLLEDLKEGKGVAGKLMTDEALADEVLGNLRQATRDLKEILEKMNRGEGTAGAFINDPQIYQDLQDVLRGIKSSRILSGMIRHYREKGEKERSKEEEKMHATESGKEGL